MVIEITTGRIRDLASFDDVKGVRAQAADALGAAASLGSLYCISFADAAVPVGRERMAATINMVHEILMRCDSGKAASYIRRRKITALLAAIGHGAGAVRNELIKLHPSSGLPGDFSAQLG